ncbi:MAG: hypothetical protein Q4B05_04045 [Candidatus Saccharibacteria bacterium]|nr:hypothetical protein [Candidatus Saccharibacteria bacterium]
MEQLNKPLLPLSVTRTSYGHGLSDESLLVLDGGVVELRWAFLDGLPYTIDESPTLLFVLRLMARLTTVAGHRRGLL